MADGSGQVLVGEGALKKGAETIASSRTELKGRLSASEGRLANVGAGWTGDAATQFTVLMARWNEDADKIVRSLDEFEANLNAASRSYQEHEERQASQLKSLLGRI